MSSEYKDIYEKYNELYDAYEESQVEIQKMVDKLLEAYDAIRKTKEYHKELMAEHERLKLFHKVIMQGVDKVESVLNGK